MYDIAKVMKCTIIKIKTTSDRKKSNINVIFIYSYLYEAKVEGLVL